MAATTDEEMEKLLSLADQISDDFRTGISQIQTLKSKFDAEVTNRHSLELTCATLKRENERLKNFRLETLNNLTVQLQQRGDCHGLRAELKRLTDEFRFKEETFRSEVESVNRSCEEKVRVLEGQIRAILRQKGVDEALIKRNCDEKIRVLEGQIRAISSQKGVDEALIKRNCDERVRVLECRINAISNQKGADEVSIRRDHDERIRCLEGQISAISSEKAADEAVIYQLHHELISCRNCLKDQEFKYQGEIEDLRGCICAEQQEKEELSKKVRNLEKELLVARTKLSEQHGSSSDKQMDVLKQKIMKMRKENEVLKRQLLASDAQEKGTI